MHDHALAFDGPGTGTAVPLDAPDLGEQTAAADVSMGKRLTANSWAAAGVMVYTDGGSYWRLALVESPAGARYAELVEMHNGVWQAQQEVGTRLPMLAGDTGGFDWTYGVSYRLRITLTRDSVVGDALGSGGAVLFHRAFALTPGVPAVRFGRVALTAVDTTARFGNVTDEADRRVAARVARRTGRYRVAVVGPHARTYAAGFRRAGLAADVVTAKQMEGPAGLDPTRFSAVLFTEGDRCPIRGKDDLIRFLHAGGDMLVIGGPLFERSIRDEQAAWQAALSGVSVGRPIVDMGTEDYSRWTRSSNDLRSPAHWQVEQTGPPEARSALRVEIGDLTGWDTLGRDMSDVFGPGQTLTTFWARGDEHTTALIVEWQERDGSRWIATVPITTHWKRCVLTPSDFLYWKDNPSKGRGGPGDHLQLPNVAHFSIGMAQSHESVAPGRKVYWIAGLATAKMPAGLTPPDLTPPTLETFSPFYAYYCLPSLHPTQAQLARLSATGDRTGPVVVPIPRPRGLGCSDQRPGRWIPLETIRDSKGVPRGTSRWLYVNLALPYRGSIWGGIAALAHPGDGPAVAAKMLARMRDGAFLAKAGTDRFSYFAGQRIPTGVQAVNFSRAARRLTVTLTIRPSPPDPLSQRRERGSARRGPSAAVRESVYGGPSLVQGEGWPKAGVRVALRPRGRESVERTLPPLAPGLYRAVTELRNGKRVVDRIVQPFSVLPNASYDRRAFVSVRGGEFYAPVLTRDGRIDVARPKRLWYPYGVNYWQSNVAGCEPSLYWLHWLNPAFYDPDIVEHDLAILQSLGFTSVSVQLNSPEHVPQVNDFVWRALRHGIRTNLFIAGAHPFFTDEALFTKLIREGRFASNPAIWAYDIAWEHHLGDHAERTAWDGDWARWIVERYGSIGHAESVWGVPVPRDATGKITNPPDDELRKDGPWLKLADAYEHCADDEISRRYGAVIRKLHALDPNHLISARSASQPSWSGWFAYDLRSSGKHFDFSSPEGYGLKPQEAGFTTAYARWAGNGKPVFWAEFGSSIYPWDTTGELEAAQAKLCRGFAQSLLDSGANGLAAWWSVGGYRVDEHSDFGIIAPDGTPRASALDLKRLAHACTSPRSTKPPTSWVTIDRDRHADGYDAVFRDHRLAYVEAARHGGMIGVHTAGTGTTSADCPLTAVGDVPYDGFEPLKFLNAEFNSVEIRDASGVWREAHFGDTIAVQRGAPVEARVSIGNTSEAKWLASAPNGAVRVIGDDRHDDWSSSLPRLSFAKPIPHDVARYQDVEIGPFAITPRIERDSEVVFTMEAAGRARFGERRRIVLRVSDR